VQVEHNFASDLSIDSDEAAWPDRLIQLAKSGPASLQTAGGWAPAQRVEAHPGITELAQENSMR